GLYHRTSGDFNIIPAPAIEFESDSVVGNVFVDARTNIVNCIPMSGGKYGRYYSVRFMIFNAEPQSGTIYANSRYWGKVIERGDTITKTVKNMKTNENPYLEKPKDFDPARRNQNKKYGGGGKSGSKK